MRNVLVNTKRFLVLATALLSLSAFADNDKGESAIETALLNEYLTICLQDAKEDNVAKADLVDYLAICVGDELESNDKESVTYEQLVKAIKSSKLINVLK